MRHAGDPLLVALNLNRDLDFGMSNEDKESSGIATLVVSLIIFVVGIWRFKNFCSENDLFLNPREEFFKRRFGNENGNKWTNPSLWPDENTQSQKDFHGL